jgi:hypothetical protein
VVFAARVMEVPAPAWVRGDAAAPVTAAAAALLAELEGTLQPLAGQPTEVTDALRRYALRGGGGGYCLCISAC